jgi:ribosomal protein S8
MKKKKKTSPTFEEVQEILQYLETEGFIKSFIDDQGEVRCRLKTTKEIMDEIKEVES